MSDKRRKIEYKNVCIDSINSILSMAINKELEIEEFEGCLQDNYIIYNDDIIHLGKNNTTRKYIVISENYLNSWSSSHNLIMTDSDELVEEYEKMFTENVA